MDIKPCPFCGGMPTIRLDDLINGRVVDDPIYYIECENVNCGVWPEASGPDRNYHSVVAAWNRRVERDVLRTRIEAMVEFRPGSEFHRGWSGALSAVLAMIEAMQAELDKPRGGDHQDSA